MSRSSIKIKANWITPAKAIAQIFISLKSYLEYPFTKKYKSATRKYFSKIYSGVLKDDYIFDGNDLLYLEKALLLFKNGSSALNNKKFEYVYDCGCGNCSFLELMKRNNIEFNHYIGIDFAIKNEMYSDEIKIIKSDLTSFEQFILTNKEQLVVFSNVLCYLSDKDFEKIIKKAKGKNVLFLIIDPVPSIFWDATFNNVKVFYRNPTKVSSIMRKYNYELSLISVDYFGKIRKQFVFPLSYGAVYIPKKENHL